MDTIDLATATPHERCACGHEWWHLADGTWALVARAWHPSLRGTPTTVAMLRRRDSSGVEQVMYADADRFDDPRPHIARHAQAEVDATHPDRRLRRVAGPPVGDVIDRAKLYHVVPFIDGDRVMVGLTAGSSPVPTALLAELERYAVLIRGRLEGSDVACLVKGCEQGADRLAWPADPVCPEHAMATVREAAVPLVEVDFPAPWLPKPVDPAREKQIRQMDLVADMRAADRPYRRRG